MRTIMILFLACALSGCVTDVSQDPPHNKLIGTVWVLKTDAYVLEYGDTRGEFLITPNTERFGVYREFSIAGKPYDERNIGRKVTGLKIVGGLRSGESLEVVRILKTSSIDMGTSYWPMMIPCKGNKWTVGKELNGENLYYGRDTSGKLFYEQGILNPDYAEILSSVTNPPPRGAEGGSGSGKGVRKGQRQGVTPEWHLVKPH